jgi:hypothetical protein
VAASTDKTTGKYNDAVLGPTVPNRYRDMGDGTFALVSAPPAEAVAFDDDGASPPNITHIGLAPPGTPTSAALWQIRKITYVGAARRILWADGDSNHDNIWDNHATTQVYS